VKIQPQWVVTPGKQTTTYIIVKHNGDISPENKPTLTTGCEKKC
jgi:hypothetical protein